MNHTLEVAMLQQAKSIEEQYKNGNNSTARAMFRQVPENRKAMIAYYITIGGVLSLAEAERFFASVTE